MALMILQFGMLNIPETESGKKKNKGSGGNNLVGLLKKVRESSSDAGWL